MAIPGITYRLEKGTSLTHQEMDNNFRSFFYSSSLHSDGDVLRLHFDTSAGDYYEIPLNTNTGSLALGSNIDNQVLTATGTVGLVQGEPNLLFSGSLLTVAGRIYQDDGSKNIFLGYEAGDSSTGANENIAIGYRTGQSVTGNYNTATGVVAIQNITNSCFNTAFGYEALNTLTAGNCNTSVGARTAINLTSGTGNVHLGFEAGPGSTIAESNKLYINNAASNTPLILGDFSTGQLTINSQVSASIFSGSFVGDGSNLTGVTAEWDGTHNGTAEITGSLVVSGSSVVVDFTNVDAISGSIFSGSFVGDGSGLTGIVGGTGIYEIGTGANSIQPASASFIANASGDFATIVGGGSNTASGNYSFVGGGIGNRACNTYSSVVGGSGNVATGSFTVIAGGINNCALGDKVTIVGGEVNTTSANYAAIVGGFNNSVSGVNSFIGGGRNNSVDHQFDAIIGGNCNTISNSVIPYTNTGHSVILGGCNNLIDSTRGYNLIGGGYNNVITGSFNSCDNYVNIIFGRCNTIDADDKNTISGGANNTIYGNFGNASIGGGAYNCITANAATIAGGVANSGSGTCSFIGGGCCNVASGGRSTIGGGFNNAAVGSLSTIGGGLCNTTIGACSGILGGFNNTINASYGVIAGGNTNTNSGASAVIAGGELNCVSSGAHNAIGGGCGNNIVGPFNSIAGGKDNAIVGCCSFIGGGFGNSVSSNVIGTTIGGGCVNIAVGDFETIGGGYGNCTCSGYSTVAGGFNNKAQAWGSGILGGSSNTVATAHSSSFVIGSDITSTRECTTYVNNLYITGSTTANSILQLSRRTTVPSPAEEGMIIASGSAGASVLYYYNGSTWNALF